MDTPAGDVYPVGKQDWDGRVLRWTYEMPSSGFLVEIVTTGVAGDILSSTWTNRAPDGTRNSGTQDFTRLRAP